MLDNRIQDQTHTARGRYPEVFARAAELIGEDWPIRVLSFGCSTGAECLDLAELFPEAEIVGAEIDNATREAARVISPHDRVTYVSPAQLSPSDEFDLITCHSVLCHHPGNAAAPLNRFWTFAGFCDAADQLDRRLRVGGYLSLVNAEFEFAATPAGRKYVPDSLRVESTVRMFDVRNRITPKGRVTPALFRKVLP